MKIAIDGRFYGLEHAGLGRYAINLIQELSQIDKNNEYYLLLRKKYFDDLQLPRNWTKILADFQHYTLEEQYRMVGILKNLKVDLTHFLHFNIPFYWQGQFVVTIHDLIMHQYNPKGSKLPLPLYLAKRIPYLMIFKRAVKESVKLIVPSNYVREEVIKYYRVPFDKIKVTYEGLDKKFVEQSDAVKKEKRLIKQNYILYAGNLYPHKNIKRLIEAVILMNKSLVEKIRLVLVTPRSDTWKKIKNEFNDKEIEESVKLFGFASDFEIGNLYKNALAFIYPSLTEGFGLQGIEAMASKTLLLASDIPVFREIYGNNAVYFDPLDIEDIINKIKSLISLNKKQKEIRIQKAAVFVQKYSWSKMAKETLSLYESCDRLRPGK